MKIRRLGGQGRFHDFDDEDDCAWCDAGRRFFERHPSESVVHLENERGGKRTITLLENDGLECEPYIFFRDD